MISKLVLAFRMWRHGRMEKRVKRLRARAVVIETKAEAISSIIYQTLTNEDWT